MTEEDQHPPTKGGSDEAHNYPRDECEKGNENIDHAGSHTDSEKVVKSGIVIVNGLFCSIMRASKLPKSYPNKENLIKQF